MTTQNVSQNNPKVPEPAVDLLVPEGPEIPAVVAIVIANDPGDHFEEMLLSLGSQDYENLSVLVVDAGSKEPVADRVARVLPAAYLHRMAGEPGWSVSANQSMELVSGSPFLLFCHDDVALDPGCVSALMAEMYRSNAGIVGPKLVDWDDERRLLQMGMSSDRVGVAVDLVDKGEFDQEQYDNPREVFYIPGGVQLIRSDLLTALGGFDPGITMMGEDLDLCWRAHALGARVMVVPQAKAKHKEAMQDRLTKRVRRKLLTRHRLRTVMSSATSKSRFTTVPLAFLLVLLEGFYSLFTGRRKQAKDVLSAIPWNISQISSINKRRKQLGKQRTLDAKAIKEKQVGGFARVSDFWHNRFSLGQNRRLDSVFSAGDRESNARDSVLLLVGIGLLLFVGSRSLLLSGYAHVGEIPFVENGGATLREWFGGWRTAGTGGPGNAPTAFAILGFFRVIFFWAPSVFEKLLIIIPLIAGFWGATSLVKPFGSPRVRALAGLVYLCNPILVSIMAAARWESLVIWAASPFLLKSLLAIGAYNPYGFDSQSETQTARTFPVRVLRFAVLTALVATFAPAVVPVALLACFMLSIAAALNAESPQNYLFTGFIAVLVSLVMHIPWSYDIVRSFSWRWLVGTKSSEALADLSLLDLLQFKTSTVTYAYIGFVTVGLAILALLLAKKKYEKLVINGWVLFLGLSFVLWIEAKGWMPFSLPASEAVLSIGLIGLILVISIGLVSLEYDLAHSISRLKQFVSILIGASFAAVFIFGIVLSFDGRWGLPRQGHDLYLSTLSVDSNDEKEQSGVGRILWIGDESVIPADSFKTSTDLSFAITEGSKVDVSSRWLPGNLAANRGIKDQVELVLADDVRRLGKLLAPYGIDKVVIINRLVPDGNYQFKPLEGAEILIDQQLDLEQIPAMPEGFIVYENASNPGIGATFKGLEEEASSAVSSQEQLQVELLAGEVTVDEVRNKPGRWVISLPENKKSLLSVSYDDALAMNGGQEPLEAGFSGLTLIPAGPSGAVTVNYPASNVRRLALLGQFLVAASAVVIAQSRRGSEYE